MKKTLVVLIAISGMAHADWYTGNDANLYEVTGNTEKVTTLGDAQDVTSDYQLKAKALDGTNQDRSAVIGEYVLRSGKTVKLMDRWQSDSTNIDLTISKLTMGEDGSGSGSVKVENAQKLTLAAVSGTLTTMELQNGATLTLTGALSMGTLKTSVNSDKSETSALLNFGTSGSINTGANQMSINIAEGASLTLSAIMSDSDLAKLAAGTDVERTLITTDKMNGISLSNLSSNLTLSLSGSELLSGGVVYSVTKDGETKYFNVADVQHAAGGWATVDESKAITLSAGTSYIVVGGLAYKDASIKTVSYLATAPIPEPTTATLSLLALAGLAARRRRK